MSGDTERKPVAARDDAVAARPALTRPAHVAVIALGCAVTMAIAAGAAWLTGQPLLAPPLGATAFLALAVPLAPSSAPRNMLYGHAIGLAAGFLALQLTGAGELPSALAHGFTFNHVLACALALMFTAAGTEGLGCSHPPAGATTLVVALGLLPAPL